MVSKKGFYWLGAALVLFGLAFLWYAFKNPQAAFPWSNTVTYIIYFVYIVITIACFVVAARKQ